MIVRYLTSFFSRVFTMRHFPRLLLRLLLLTLFSSSAYAGIANTKHNLSVTGTGNIKASSEQEICIFCHTPHNSRPQTPLWNRASSGSVYTPYNSSTIFSSPGQPTGASMLCLSCHDGTIALGSVLSRNSDIVMNNGVTTYATGQDPDRHGSFRRPSDFIQLHPGTCLTTW